MYIDRALSADAHSLCTHTHTHTHTHHRELLASDGFSFFPITYTGSVNYSKTPKTFTISGNFILKDHYVNRVN